MFKTEKSIIFPNFWKELIDVDFLFKKSNENYVETCRILNIPADFNFSKRFSKRLYTHEFLKVICDWLKTRINVNYSPYFFNHLSTKDEFRNSILKKLTSVFGFRVWDYSKPIDEFYKELISNKVEIFKFHIFLQEFKKPKPFKGIKKYLQNTGLDYMNDVYLEDLGNKMRILR